MLTLLAALPSEDPGTDPGGIVLDFGNQAVIQGIPGATALWDVAPGAAFGQLIAQVLMIALTVGGIALFVYLLWGALDWLTSAGDKGKTEKARDKITQAVVGLILLISTVAIMLFVQQLLGICVIDFGGTQCQTSASSSSGGSGSPTTCASLGATCVSAPVECTENGGNLQSGTCSGGRYCCKY